MVHPLEADLLNMGIVRVIGRDRYFPKIMVIQYGRGFYDFLEFDSDIRFFVGGARFTQKADDFLMVRVQEFRKLLAYPFYVRFHG
jgi:hypothetical protein